MYWGKKCAEYTVTLLVIIIINFLACRLLPGDPFYYLNYNSDLGYSDVVVTAETHEKLTEYYGLDLPLHLQFTRFVGKLAHGDLGFSIYHNMPVKTLIKGALPWTLLLMGTAFIIATILGILIGAKSAWQRDSFFDKFALNSMVILNRVPSFIIAIFVLILLGAKLQIFPLAGARTAYASFSSPFAYIADIIWHLILPAVTLIIAELCHPYLLTRNTMIGVIKKDYVWAAKTRGIKDRLIKYRYALRNALIPVVTARFMRLGHLIGGSIFIEMVFAYPGLGKLMYDSLQVNDYPVLDGIFLILAVSVVGANFIADQLIHYLDKRVDIYEV